jgi:iron complex outermembrane receptor protein
MSRFFPLASVYTFSSAALLSPLSETAFAQETNSQIIEEVTVTALKRETLLQETPISLLAVSGLDLAERQIDSVAELLRASPGLTVLDQGPGQRRLVIRGIQSAGEAQVGLYYDEAPLGGGAPSTTNDAGLRMPEVRLFDVDRIEVLRGPQGTLFGAGSMAGTVRVIFNKPSQRYEAVADASYERVEDGDAGYHVNGMVNVPLVDDRLAMRTVLYYRDRGGYVDNLTLRRDDINEEDSRGGRVMFRYTPNDALTLDASVHVQRDDGYLSAWEIPVGEYNTAVPTQLPVVDDFDLYNLTLNWNLGFATFTGVSSYFERDLFDDVAIGRELSSAFGTDLALSVPPRTVGVNIRQSF